MFLIKSLIVFLIVLLIVLFALSNAHHVPLNLIVGGPINVKAIYLVLSSYLLGILSAAYVFAMLKIHSRRKNRALKEEESDTAEPEIE